MPNIPLLRGESYRVKLTVTDDNGLSGTCEAEIEVVMTPPQAEISIEDTEVIMGQTIVFDASNSKGPDGQILSYEWDFGDGTTASGITVEHRYAEPVTYSVSLKVVDDDGLSNVTTVRVRVKPVVYTLAQAMEEKLVKAEVTGLGAYNLLRIELENLAPYTVNIMIPEGTVFLATGNFPNVIHERVLGITRE